jgi:hypothetical protein
MAVGILEVSLISGKGLKRSDFLGNDLSILSDFVSFDHLKNPFTTIYIFLGFV